MFCLCVGHDHRSHSIKNRGYRLRSKIKVRVCVCVCVLHKYIARPCAMLICTSHGRTIHIVYAIAFVRPSVSTLTFESSDLWPWAFACIGSWPALSWYRRSKWQVKVKGQGRGSTRSVWRRSSIVDRQFYITMRWSLLPCRYTKADGRVEHRPVY